MAPNVFKRKILKIIRKLFSYLIIAILTLFIALISTFIYRIIKDDESPLEQAENSSILNNLDGPYNVIKVVDGDTLIIDYDGENRYVRFIGIDTPESVNPDETKNTEEGKIASDYTKSIITDKIYLEYDIQKEDKYGRLLAYVYLNDGTFLNEKIILEGYAYILTVVPNVKYMLKFKNAFDDARDNQRGLWKNE